MTCLDLNTLSFSDDSEAVLRRLERIYDLLERHSAKEFCDIDRKGDFKR